MAEAGSKAGEFAQFSIDYVVTDMVILIVPSSLVQANVHSQAMAIYRLWDHLPTYCHARLLLLP